MVIFLGTLCSAMHLVPWILSLSSDKNIWIALTPFAPTSSTLHHCHTPHPPTPLIFSSDNWFSVKFNFSDHFFCPWQRTHFRSARLSSRQVTFFRALASLPFWLFCGRTILLFMDGWIEMYILIQCREIGAKDIPHAVSNEYFSSEWHAIWIITSFFSY